MKSAVLVTSFIVSVSRQVRNNSCGGDAMDGDGDKAESAAVTESKMSKDPSTTTKSNSDNPTTTNPVKQAHSDDDSGCALEEYTWVPPGLKPDQVGTNDDNVVVALCDIHVLRGIFQSTVGELNRAKSPKPPTEHMSEKYDQWVL